MKRSLTPCWAVSAFAFAFAFAFGLLMTASRAHAQVEESSAPSAVSNSTPLVFSQLSKPGAIPARLQLKALGKGWQRLTLENDQDDSYTIYYGSMSGQFFQDALARAGIGVYFTKGQSVVMGGETFLVAYRLDTGMTSDDIQNLFRNMGGHGDDGPQQGPRKFLPDTVLRLSLLNLRTVGSLKDVRPFEAQREIMGPREITEASDANLRQLGALLIQLPQRGYGITRPPLEDAVALRRTFTTYFHSRASLFVHPQTKEPYRTNATLTKIPLRIIPNRAQVVAIYEARPGSDGKYGVVFLDGHTARVPQAQWSRVRAVMPRKPGELEVRRLSETNLRQLYNQVVYFTRFRQGHLPQMRNANYLRSDLSNYSGAWNSTYYSHPLTGENYRPNELLSGKVLKDIANRSQLVALYEATPGSDGKRGVIFLDGHLSRIASADWNKARSVTVVMKKAASKA